MAFHYHYFEVAGPALASRVALEEIKGWSVVSITPNVVEWGSEHQPFIVVMRVEMTIAQTYALAQTPQNPELT